MEDADGLPELAPGSRVGAYTIRGAVGTGCEPRFLAEGEGEVVEIAVVHLGGDDAVGPRFVREMGRVALDLGVHPALRRLHAVGARAGRGWLAVTPAVGVSLFEWWAAAPRSWVEVFSVVQQVAAAISAVEEVGLRGAPLEGEDVRVGSKGEVQVDVIAVSAARLRSKELHAMLGHATRHMSPEEWQGQAPTRWSSQFSLCSLVWSVVYGCPPFVGETLLQRGMASVEGRTREPPQDRLLPVKAHAALVRGLASEPGARWPSLAELVAALAPRRGLFGWLRR